jgi:hypothetical protein
MSTDNFDNTRTNIDYEDDDDIYSDMPGLEDGYAPSYALSEIVQNNSDDIDNKTKDNSLIANETIQSNNNNVDTNVDTNVFNEDDYSKTIFNQKVGKIFAKIVNENNYATDDDDNKMEKLLGDFSIESQHDKMTDDIINHRDNMNKKINNPYANFDNQPKYKYDERPHDRLHFLNRSEQCGETIIHLLSIDSKPKTLCGGIGKSGVAILLCDKIGHLRTDLNHPRVIVVEAPPNNNNNNNNNIAVADLNATNKKLKRDKKLFDNSKRNNMNNKQKEALKLEKKFRNYGKK